MLNAQLISSYNKLFIDRNAIRLTLSNAADTQLNKTLKYQS